MGKLKYSETNNKRIPYFPGFMSRYSKHAYQKMRNRLLEFVFWLKGNYGVAILNANTDHILDYFDNVVNNKDVGRKHKRSFRALLNVYFEYVKEIKEKIEKETGFINPVPSKHLYKFTEKTITLAELEKAEDILDSYEIVDQILNYLYFTRHRLYVIVSILLYTGARISEVVSIELANIDLEEKYFYVKVKSKKFDNRWGLYFLPKFFIPLLKEWINKIKLEYIDEEYLFPGFKTHITTDTPRKELRLVKSMLNLSCKINPHVFRDFINTERFDAGLNKKYRSLLLNQTPKDVNTKNYLKKYKKRKKLQDIYDSSFPFPEFKPKTNLMRS